MIIRPGHIFETVNLVGHRARDKLKSLWNIFLQDTTRTKKFGVLQSCGQAIHLKDFSISEFSTT